MANLNLNKVVLGGRLTAAPELRSTPNNVRVCSFTIATKRKGRNAETDFINCIAWRETAETIVQYLGKGSAICVVGSIQVRKWTDQYGQTRYATEVIVDEFYFVDSKSEASAPPVNVPPAAPVQQTMEEVSDDDLPF